MNLIVNIILILLSYQCITVFCTVQEGQLRQYPNVTSNNPSDCYAKPIRLNFEKMPIIFMANSTSPYILHPDIDGIYHFTHGSSVMISCMGSTFEKPHQYLARELRLNCINGFLYYKDNPQILSQYKCTKTPHSKLIMTDRKCHYNNTNRVILVGFVTSRGFIVLYKICYDPVGKNALYSWVFVKAPISKYRQISNRTPRYIVTANYADVFPVSAYNNQTTTIEKILDSKQLSLKYIRKRFGRSYLTQCYLTPRNLFPYIFEQDATLYFENTVPQWIEFNRYVWKELEVLFKQNMIRGDKEHIIITGTYGTLSLEDEKGMPQPIYLNLPMRLKVPLYVWKMYYDIKNGQGTVFIGLNNPYMKIDGNTFFCKTIRCPGSMLRKNSSKDLIFCCTKQSFERAYGPIDPVVFIPFIPDKDDKS